MNTNILSLNKNFMATPLSWTQPDSVFQSGIVDYFLFVCKTDVLNQRYLFQ